MKHILPSERLAGSYAPDQHHREVGLADPAAENPITHPHHLCGGRPDGADPDPLLGWG